MPWERASAAGWLGRWSPRWGDPVAGNLQAAGHAALVVGFGLRPGSLAPDGLFHHAFGSFLLVGVEPVVLRRHKPRTPQPCGTLVSAGAAAVLLSLFMVYASVVWAVDNAPMDHMIVGVAMGYFEEIAAGTQTRLT